MLPAVATMLVTPPRPTKPSKTLSFIIPTNGTDVVKVTRLVRSSVWPSSNVPVAV
jgi:hypothetical protein